VSLGETADDVEENAPDNAEEKNAEEDDFPGFSVDGVP
jgi:hypothetical protein